MAAMLDFGPADCDLTPFAQSAPYAAAMRACGAEVWMADLGCGWAQGLSCGGWGIWYWSFRSDRRGAMPSWQRRSGRAG